MGKKIVIVYSNLGLGGIPIKIVDIVNQAAILQPETPISILLKKNRTFNLQSLITNANVKTSIFTAPFFMNNSFVFVVWMWLYCFFYKPTHIISFISAYSIPVLLLKKIFFWRKQIIVVNEDHYTSTMIYHMLFPWIQSLGIKYLYPLADRIIVPTKAIAKDLQFTFNIRFNNLLVVQNWSKYANRRLTRGARPYDIVYVGRIDKTKNVLSLLSLLLTVFKEHKRPLHCAIVGEGPDLTECVDYIKANNLTKIISIYPSTINISTYLRKAKIFVFNPNKDTEGFPFAVLDAMSCGAIVVTRYFYGVNEVIRNNHNGFIAYSDTEMSDRILSVLKNYNSLNSVIAFAKSRVSLYNSLTNIEKYFY